MRCHDAMSIKESMASSFKVLLDDMNQFSNKLSRWKRVSWSQRTTRFEITVGKKAQTHSMPIPDFVSKWVI